MACGPTVTAIYLHVANDNTAARTLYERVGFKPVATPSSDVTPASSEEVPRDETEILRCHETEVGAVESDTDVPEGEMLMCLRVNTSISTMNV